MRKNKDVVFLAYVIAFSILFGFSLLCFVLVGLYKAGTTKADSMMCHNALVMGNKQYIERCRCFHEGMKIDCIYKGKNI